MKYSKQPASGESCLKHPSFQRTIMLCKHTPVLTPYMWTNSGGSRTRVPKHSVNLNISGLAGLTKNITVRLLISAAGRKYNPEQYHNICFNIIILVCNYISTRIHVKIFQNQQCMHSYLRSNNIILIK